MTRSRRGTSLVEVMVVLVISIAVLSAVTVCMHGMFRAEQAARQAAAHRAAVGRLSVVLREDAHAAVSVRRSSDVAGTAPGLVLVQPGGREIEYRLQDSDLTRVVRAAGQSVHRDAFRLARGARVAWHVDQQPGPLAAVEIHRLADPRVPGVDAVDRLETAIGIAASPEGTTHGP